MQEEQEDTTVGPEESELTAEQFDEEVQYNMHNFSLSLYKWQLLRVQEPEMAEDDDEGGFLDLEGLKTISSKQVCGLTI